MSGKLHKPAEFADHIEQNKVRRNMRNVSIMCRALWRETLEHTTITPGEYSQGEIDARIANGDFLANINQ